MQNQGDWRRTDAPTSGDNVPPHHRSSTGPVVAEVLLGLLGIYGVGWLIAGRARLGAILLILSLLWIIIAGVATIHTFGVAICGAVPANVLFMALSAIALHRSIHRAG
jgi:hypothetical protein